MIFKRKIRISFTPNSFSSVLFLILKSSMLAVQLSSELTKRWHLSALDFTKSYHPSNCKESIPYGQATYIKRICSNPNQLKISLNNLNDWLANREYKQQVVIQDIHQVDGCGLKQQHFWMIKQCWKLSTMF